MSLRQNLSMSAPTNPLTSKPLSILYAEDNKLLYTMGLATFKKLFPQSTVCHVLCAELALYQLNKGKYDVVIMDDLMPINDAAIKQAKNLGVTGKVREITGSEAVKEFVESENYENLAKKPKIFASSSSKTDFLYVVGNLEKPTINTLINNAKFTSVIQEINKNFDRDSISASSSPNTSAKSSFNPRLYKSYESSDDEYFDANEDFSEDSTPELR